MKKTIMLAALMCLCLQAGSAAAQNAYPCAENADCRLVTSFVPPAGERPGKTLVRCAHRDQPLKEGDTITPYNDYLTSKCVCLAEQESCGLED